MRFFWYKIWLNALRRILPLDYFQFRKITRRFNLPLSYKLNKDAILTLEDILIDNEYARYFPMHKKAIVIDVGAHYGYFSLFAWRNLKPESTILALEPSSLNFKVLSNNLEAVGVKAVIPIQKALSHEDGMISFMQSGLSINHRIGGPDEPGTEKVPAICLESLLLEYQINQVDFLKLDIEGGEFTLLLHTPDETLQKIRVYSLEFHQSPVNSVVDLIDRFKALGYQIAHYDFVANDRSEMGQTGHLVAVRMLAS